MLLLSALPMRANQLTALNVLCFAPWLQRCCTLCGLVLPLAPVPRCARCGRLLVLSVEADVRTHLLNPRRS
jgi:hypothetical protein